MPSRSMGDETAGGPPRSRLLAEPVLVVRRKPHKGRRPEYGVFDADERQVARGVYVSDDEIRPLMRSCGLRHWTAAALRVVDAQGDTVFLVVFPGWRGRGVLLISNAEGHEVGEAIKTRGFLRMTYELRYGKRRIGAIRVMDRRQRRAVITDETGVEVAVVRTEAGETPSAVDDAGEAYSLEVHAPLQEPLRSLVVACANCTAGRHRLGTSVGETGVLKNVSSLGHSISSAGGRTAVSASLPAGPSGLQDLMRWDRRRAGHEPARRRRGSARNCALDMSN